MLGVASLEKKIYGSGEEKTATAIFLKVPPTMVQWIDKYYCHLHLLPSFPYLPPPFYPPFRNKEKWYQTVQNISSFLFSCRPSHGQYGINKHLAY
jgi:hypothetical protein